MSLSKQKIMTLAGGGVFALAAVVLAVLVFLAWSSLEAARGEGDSEADSSENPLATLGLESEEAKCLQLCGENPYPDKSSVVAVKTNQAEYASWCTHALAQISEGDVARDTTTSPSQFNKNFQDTCEMLRKLEGGTVGTGCISTADFMFGFDEYAGGTLPSSDQVPFVMAQLETITDVVKILHQAGVLEVRKITREPATKKEALEDEGVPQKKPAQKAKKDDAMPVFVETEQTFDFEIATPPIGLVNALNALTSSKRFYVVKNLSFTETKDFIKDNISAARNKDKEKTRTSSRRRRGAAAALPEEKKDKFAGVVINSEQEQLTVSFTLVVHDFGRAQEVAPAPASEAVTPALTPTNQVQKVEKKEVK